MDEEFAEVEPTQPTELRPPPEHADKPLHWIAREGEVPTVWCWAPRRCAGWSAVDPYHEGAQCWTPPRAAAALGYHYLGPAEWRDGESDPTADEIEDLALCISAAFHNTSYGGVEADPKWCAVAATVLDHPAYTARLAIARHEIIQSSPVMVAEPVTASCRATETTSVDLSGTLLAKNLGAPGTANDLTDMTLDALIAERDRCGAGGWTVEAERIQAEIDQRIQAAGEATHAGGWK